MNRCFFFGKIIEISDYKFFYNSKAHNAKINLKIKTLENKFEKSEIIISCAYDDIADNIYQNYVSSDIISVEGELTQNMEVNILNIEK